jgi:predicted DNA binding CopG/RHH family protein
MPETIKSSRRIPKFKNIQEEAEFWDTHDTGDFADEFRPVKVKFAKNLSEALSIRLDTKTLDDLRKQAAKKGIGPTTLARMWILEHLEAARAQRPRSRTRKAS